MTMAIASDLNWSSLGKQLRQCAIDAHGPKLIPVALSYRFLLDNPECFVFEGEEWPEFMPVDAPVELIAAYYGAV